MVIATPALASRCFTVLAGLFALLGASLLIFGLIYGNKSQTIKEHFRRGWITIDGSLWLRLPDYIILSTLSLVRKSSHMFRLLFRRDGWIPIAISYYMFINTILLVGLVLWLNYGLTTALLLSAALLFLPSALFLAIEFLDQRFADENFQQYIHFWTWGFMGSCKILLSACSLLCFFWLLSHSTLAQAILSAVFFTPSTVYALFLIPRAVTEYKESLYGITHGTASENVSVPESVPYSSVKISYIKLQSEGYVFLFCVGGASSFVVTLISLSIGHSLYPNSWLPQTTQMLLSNLCCDGASLVVAVRVLAWAVSRPGLFRIPAGIILDLILACFFALLSLYLGLIKTDHSLSFLQVARVLVGSDPDGHAWQVGPYFWVMHTVFLPILLYVFVVFISWLGKAMLIPVRWFFKTGVETRRPIELTSGLLGLLAGICTIIAGLI